ncbi:MAG: type V CRISPR-associated protein Cas12b [Elusimicrobia bacterium]|nr:type V CRISPR-associated protein Cas12b [Elusimicrobiota bacterium]
MSDPVSFGTTQRAYTMRLQGPMDGGDSWMDRLWITHDKVNRGAKVFGEFLLTLRGGLPASAIDGAEDDLAARRRLLALCWFTVESEDSATADFRVSHQDVPGGQGGRRADEKKMEQALRECLESKDIPASARADWMRDCGHALKARIRDDAVWVQRWKMYEDLHSKPDPAEVRAILFELLGRDFLSPYVEGKKGRRTKSAESGKQEEDKEKPAEPIARAEQFDHVRRTARRLEGEWFGQGKKRDFSALTAAYGALKNISEKLAEEPPRTMAALKKMVLAARQEEGWELVRPKKKEGSVIAVGEMALANSGPSPRARSTWDRILLAIRADEPDALPSGRGDQFLKADFWKGLAEDAAKTIEKKSDRGTVGRGADWTASLLQRVQTEAGIAYKPNSEMTEFFRFMLGAAAARVAQTHSWVRRAEALRDDASMKESNLEKKFQSGAWLKAREWLDDYLERRSERSGASGLMTIRKNAIDGWDKVVQRWTVIPTAGEQAVEERRTAVKELQESEEKFGDAVLFDALALEEASCVWRLAGKPAPELLKAFVEWRQAEYDTRRYKVPRYCHPDALLHPVFCQFGKDKPGIEYGWRKAAATTDRSQATKVDVLLLDSSGGADWVEMRWQGKRLLRDLGFSETTAQFSGISRDTRLGRGASGVVSFDAPSERPKHLFEKNAKPWNARLEAPRGLLERMAQLITKGKRDQVERIRRRIGWFLTFSPDLIKQGPWHSFVSIPAVRNVLKSDGAPVSVNARKGTTYWKSGFGWMVRPGLGIFPGIRVLGMDLGHRHGAACAVWQQVSDDEVSQAAKRAAVQPPAKPEISFCCDDPSRELCKGGTRKGKLPQLIFRRVGPDSWARLERQFLIRLPGEIEGARALAVWERGWLESFVKGFGKTFGSDEERGRWKERMGADVALARLEALKLAARALRRHGDRVRIAHALVSSEMPGMGGRMQKISSAQDRLPHLVRAMGLWDLMANSTWWKDDEAAALWKNRVVPVASELGAELPLSDEDASLQAAKAARKKREALYSKVSEKLASEAKLSKEIADFFFASWGREDAAWKARLRALSLWIAKGAVWDKTGKWSRKPQVQRNAGGLSLVRISALEQLARLQRAFAQRPTRETVFRMAEEGERHARRMREKLERLREDRLKKLANAVAMGAMGLVGMEKDKLARVEKARREGPRFAPTHVVVIESLSHYRPEASRTRRENRGLMSWSAREMARRLKDQCDLHGLLMLEASAAYTSRFCSRCGSPGSRCEELFLRELENSYWSKERRKALDTPENSRTPSHRYLLALDPMNTPDRRVRLPREGGALFVCSNDRCQISGGGLQADLNAAANIGIRAMLDGRWRGAWQYLPTVGSIPDLKSFALKGASEDLKNLKIKIGGGGNGKPIRNKAKSNGRNVFNAFRDVTQGVDPSVSIWKPYRQFWQDAANRVIERLLHPQPRVKKSVPAKNP